MRFPSAWACLGLVMACTSATLAVVGPIASQDTPEAGDVVGTRPATSLDLGKPYDSTAQQSFAQKLTFDERAALIELESRYALADADCPLPTSEPEAVFYVKFRSPMGAEFAQQLTDAGATFVGYAALHCHFIHARDAESLERIGHLLRNAPHVAGTLLRREMDQCEEKAYAHLTDPAFESGEFRVTFWLTTDPRDAQALLAAHDAPVLEASVDDYSELDLVTPFIDTRLTATALKAFARSPLVAWVQTRPVWMTHNVDSTNLSNAQAADIGGSPYNLNGQGYVAGVWDGGRARDTHQDLQSAGSPNPINNGTKRVRKMDGTSEHYHATHVVGTVIGDGSGNASARGYAPEAFVLSYDWNSMDSERRTARNQYRHVADNHSYGNSGGGTGGYDGSAQASDSDIRDLFINMCKSAGNDGSGDNSCSDDTCMKNAYVIGATNDPPGGSIAGFSSRGPTDDGRLIPHFCANGVGVTSTYSSSSSSSNSLYASLDGTSMSGPSACGSLVLISQLYDREMNNRFLAPDAGRAIVALTAIDMGNAGPDYRYGFGIVDCKRACDLILADESSGGRHIVRGQVRQGGMVEYDCVVTSSATPLRVVCSWLDLPGTTGAGTKLVNDLDLELVAPNGSTVHFPYRGLTATGSQTHVWTQTAANRRDNIELASVTSPATGIWKIRVRGFSIPANAQGTYPNNVQGFVLACERQITTSKIIMEDALNAAGPVTIPDNNPSGLSRTFNVGDTRSITGVRLYVDVRHTARGNIRITLTHPSATTVTLEMSDTNTKDDLIAIYPDTRQFDNDVTTLLTRPANGTWTVVVSDLTSGTVGTLEYLTLEIDVDASGTPGNNPPNANAGIDQTVNEGTLVNLNGTASNDPDADPLTYIWTQTAGPSVTLTGVTTATPSFTAPLVGSNQVCTFQLAVSDGQGGQDTDTVNINVQNIVVPNTPPNANAGTDFSIQSGQPGALDGTGSNDPNGDPITYSWAEIGTGWLILAGANTATPTFTAPTVAASTPVTMRLTVNDGQAQDTDDVIVTLTPLPTNNPPVANAGADQSVAQNASVLLDGSASSDPDLDTLTFQWTQIGGVNPVILNNETTATPDFMAPAANDVLVFQLLVNDGNGEIDIDTVTITIGGGGTSGGGGGGGKKDDGGCSTSGSSGWLWLMLMVAAGAWLGLRRIPRRD